MKYHWTVQGLVNTDGAPKKSLLPAYKHLSQHMINSLYLYSRTNSWLVNDRLIVIVPFLGVERREKVCVGSGIGYVSWDQDQVWVGFIQCGLDKVLNIFSFVIANRLIAQQFSELRYHEGCTHKENGTVNMELTVTLDIRTGRSGRVSWVEFCAQFPDVSGLGVRSTLIMVCIWPILAVLNPI